MNIFLVYGKSSVVRDIKTFRKNKKLLDRPQKYSRF